MKVFSFSKRSRLLGALQNFFSAGVSQDWILEAIFTINGGQN
jgi:hypothetical protein